MDYVRTFAPDSLSRDKFDWQILAELESYVVVGCRAPGTVPGPLHHKHPSDQLYFILSGSMELELNGTPYAIGPDTAVWIPEGTPHTNRYPGPDDEVHIDVILPPRRRTAQGWPSASTWTLGVEPETPSFEKRRASSPTSRRRTSCPGS